MVIWYLKGRGRFINHNYFIFKYILTTKLNNNARPSMQQRTHSIARLAIHTLLSLTIHFIINGERHSLASFFSVRPGNPGRNLADHLITAAFPRSVVRPRYGCSSIRLNLAVIRQRRLNFARGFFLVPNSSGVPRYRGAVLLYGGGVQQDVESRRTNKHITQLSIN